MGPQTAQVGVISNMGPGTLEKLADLHEQLAATYRELAQQAGTRESESDRVIGLEEAATKIGATRSWLRRRPNWQRVGGHRGADRRIHFPLSGLAEYMRTQRKHG